MVDLHPLLGDLGLIKMLNTAATLHWNGRDGTRIAALAAVFGVSIEDGSRPARAGSTQS